MNKEIPKEFSKELTCILQRIFNIFFTRKINSIFNLPFLDLISSNIVLNS